MSGFYEAVLLHVIRGCEICGGNKLLVSECPEFLKLGIEMPVYKES